MIGRVEIGDEHGHDREGGRCRDACGSARVTARKAKAGRDMFENWRTDDRRNRSNAKNDRTVDSDKWATRIAAGFRPRYVMTVYKS